jgi:hypothetical protein
VAAHAHYSDPGGTNIAYHLRLRFPVSGNSIIRLRSTNPFVFRSTGSQKFSTTTLGGHPKTGQWWSPQNRPIESSQDKGSYSASAGAPASIILVGFVFSFGLWQTDATWVEDTATLGSDRSANSEADRAGWQHHPAFGTC